MVPKAGPITVPAWDQESRDTSALTPKEYARLNRMVEDSGEPPRIHWPQWMRVRVGGELSYTKMLTGAAVERRANLTPLDYRRTEDPVRNKFQPLHRLLGLIYSSASRVSS